MIRCLKTFTSFGFDHRKILKMYLKPMLWPKKRSQSATTQLLELGSTLSH